MKEFGENFKALRILKNKSQKEMAELLHVSQSTISHWKAGRKTPEVPMLITGAKFFDVSVDYLLGLED